MTITITADKPHTIGGYITTDLATARREHEAQGGYLLRIGSAPIEYAVCAEAEAISAWGRTPEHLAALAPHYSEAD